MDVHTQAERDHARSVLADMLDELEFYPHATAIREGSDIWNAGLEVLVAAIKAGMPGS